ncbi:MAG: transglycosylase SLT domain-containing protein [Candidatus Protistobacter heckmanni]|nr:transglycosylase SLT domain-containing protein [Candidatus Protistobacter heckmanni]
MLEGNSRRLKFQRGFKALAGLALALALTHADTQGAPRRPDPLTPDDTFVALREAARVNDIAQADALAARLYCYGEPAYVDYFRIKARMYDSGGNVRSDAPDAEIHAFLQRYAGMAIADRMRNDWLLVLGKRRDWPQFDQEYPRFVLNDDTQVKCYALLSRILAKSSPAQTLSDEAAALLTEPKYYGEGCIDLIGALAQNYLIPRDQIRMQARWALEKNLNTLARRIANVTNDDRADNDPLATVTKSARNDPAAAAKAFQHVAPSLSADEQGAGWAVIGAFYARKFAAAEALAAYRRQQALGGEALLSPETREWKVRAALVGGDWSLALRAIDGMLEGLRRRDPAWTYWHGRALKALGSDKAAADFQQLAGAYHFYGQLSREELGQKIAVPARTTVGEPEIDAMRGRAGFARAQKFFDLNLRFEGTREWNWELRGMSDRELLAAAEYAKRINLLDRTVNTADRTQTEHDFSLRYIAPFLDLMQTTTDKIGLDIAWTYGLIRQESRFIMNARSSVGASGLMQVMPSTAKYVARKIGLDSYSHGSLDDVGTNILLGTSYLNMVLADLDGSQPLASAAYNAGPSRSKGWRAALPRSVEGAIFAEAIPFAETRTYVKNVMANATLYAALFIGQPQSLKARLGQIAPRPPNGSNLP